jgi:hypothetical protein
MQSPCAQVAPLLGHLSPGLSSLALFFLVVRSYKHIALNTPPPLFEHHGAQAAQRAGRWRHCFQPAFLILAFAQLLRPGASIERQWRCRHLHSHSHGRRTDPRPVCKTQAALQRTSQAYGGAMVAHNRPRARTCRVATHGRMHWPCWFP